MNTMNSTPPSSSLVAHAVALAEAHSQGFEKRCRRWRRRAAVKRIVVMTLLVVAMLFVVGSINAAFAQQTYAMGELPTGEAVANVRQIMMLP